MAKAELIYLATDTGLITLSNPGGIGRWLKAGHTQTGHTLCTVWSNPHDPTHVICGDGNQLWQSHDGAQSWHDIAGPACRHLVASRTRPTYILAGDGANAWLSPDAGTTWRHLGHAQHVGMAGDTLWYDQMVSTDGGLTWHAQSTTIVGINVDAKSRLTRHPDGTWYADSTAIPPPPVSCLSWVICGGMPWTGVGADGSAVWRYQEIWEHQPQIPAHLVVSSSYHPDHVWAASRTGSLWLSSDRGINWGDIRHGLSSINALSSVRLL